MGKKLVARQQAQALKATWRAVVRLALITLGGKAKLDDIYARIASDAPGQLATTNNWQAKVRQTLQLTGQSVERGVWAI